MCIELEKQADQGLKRHVDILFAKLCLSYGSVTFSRKTCLLEIIYLALTLTLTQANCGTKSSNQIEVFKMEYSGGTQQLLCLECLLAREQFSPSTSSCQLTSYNAWFSHVKH